MRKTMNWFSTGMLVTGLVSTALLGAIACGDDTDGDDNSGGARSTASPDTSSIDAEIAKLREELKSAGAEEREALLAQIEALENELANLGRCGFGGECTGMDSAITSLTPVFEAMCASIFGCCTAGEARVAFGASVASEEDCVAAFTERAQSGQDINGLSYGVFQLESEFELPEVDELANSLELGRVAIDEDSIADCVATIDAFDCRANRFDYGCALTDSPCDEDNFIIGLVEEGGSCNPWSDFDECADGGLCRGEGNEGICVKVIDTHCLSDDDCGYGHASTTLRAGVEYTADYYCDLEEARCAEAGELGDDCGFASDDWDLGDVFLEEPCKEGLLCSPFSSTCVPACGTGSTCGGSVSCPPRHTCEAVETRSSYRNHSYGYAAGICVELAEVGDDCQHYGECESNICEDGKCAESCHDNPDVCSSDEWCRYTGCLAKIANGQFCSGGSESCESGLCVNRYCAAQVASGEACGGSEAEFSAVCPAGEYCNGANCTVLISTGESCSANHNCESNYCTGGVCTERLAEGVACNAEASADANWSDKEGVDPCESGTFCKPESSQSYAGVCMARIEEGGICHPNIEASISQCADTGTACFAPDQTTTSVQICPAAESSWDNATVCTIGGAGVFQ